MKEKIKKILKNRIFICILTAIIFGTIGASAATYFPSKDVTYDNTESGLKSTDVQGAIDELYNNCFPPESPTVGDIILDKVPIVTNGDGLYKDEYEEGRYFYKGANTNNYITFNGETAGWRIMSIESDGTIKITKINTNFLARFNEFQFTNDWKDATINIYLNGNVLYDELNSTARNQIVYHDWNIGQVSNENDNLQNQISNENSSKWNGKIALPTVSEYLRTNSNTSCNTFYKYSNNYDVCKNSTWLFYKNFKNYSGMWTLSPSPGYLSSGGLAVYLVYYDGRIIRKDIDENSSLDYTYPTLYLSSSVKIKGGTGTESNPYTIE